MIGIGISPYLNIGSKLNLLKSPTDLILTILSDTSIKLDWTAGGGQEGHSIERSTDGITYVEIATVLGATETLTDTGLTGYTIYYYRVRSFKGTRYSDYCNVNFDAPVNYLFYDSFRTNEAAPMITPRTASPGPGTVAVSSKFSIVNQKLTKIAGETPKQTYTGNNNTFQSGVAVCFEFYSGFSEANFGPILSLTSDNKPAITKFGLTIDGNPYSVTRVSAVDFQDVAKKWIVLTNGYVFLIYDNRLMYIYPQVNTAKTIRVLVDTFDSAFSAEINSIKSCILPTPFNGDFSLATTRLAGQRSAGDLFTHEVSSLIEFTVTALPTSGIIDIRFRQYDESNYWNLTINTSGESTLSEVVAGTPTVRGTATGLLNNSHCVISLDNTDITIILNNTYKIRYQIAYSFRTATSAVLETINDAIISDIVCWPKILGATEQKILNAVNHDNVNHDELPIYDDDMEFYVGNPVITTQSTGTNGFTCADPFLYVINNKLYCFFESTGLGAGGVDGWGEIWMGESTDGINFSNYLKITGSPGVHYAHPTVYEEDGIIHCYVQKGSGLIGHLSSTVVGFPNWSTETNVFNSESLGWPHMREFEIFKHTDNNYYLLGITSNEALVEDKYVRGLWCNFLPTNWNTEGASMSENPLIAIDADGWAKGIVEITRLISNGRLIFYFGVTKTDNIEKLGAYEVTSLTPTGMTGNWIKNDYTFVGSKFTGWDIARKHRMSSAYFDNKWVVAYDACYNNVEWRIGIATKVI